MRSFTVRSHWSHATAAVVMAVLVGVSGCTSHTSSASPAPSATPTTTATSTPTSTPTGVPAGTPCGVAAQAPAYKHVIWIWMENHSFAEVIGSPDAPYINKLATECGLATNYQSVTHPSLPNYLAATSGQPLDELPKLGFADCSPGPLCSSEAPSVFGQGETWRAYQESMPSPCATANSGPYAVRHNPPTYYTTLTGCAANDVPYSQLAVDLSSGSLPAFSFITPNLNNDMHDGTVAQGSAWLASQLPLIFKSKDYQDRSTAVFITWDEGDGGFAGENCADAASDTSCHIPTLVISPSTPAGARSQTAFSHYSLLATAEKLLGLPLLGKAATAPSMIDAFRL